MNFELKQHFQIESARFLPNLAKSHPCAHMHGHSFKIILSKILSSMGCLMTLIKNYLLKTDRYT